MATRFYLPSSGSPDISPAYSASWDRTDEGARLAMVRTKIASEVGEPFAFNLVGGDYDALIRQYVSEPIAAQTIGVQTVKLVMRAFEGDTSYNFFLAMVIRVIAPDATTVRGTILAITRDNTEIGTDFLSRTFSATTSSVTAQSGDYIVVEIGLGGPATALGTIGIIANGDDSGSDLADSDTDDAGDPWLEFANSISFVSDVITLAPSPAVVAFATVTPTIVRPGVTMLPSPAVFTYAIPAPTFIGPFEIRPSPVVMSMATVTPTITRGSLVITPSPALFQLTVPAAAFAFPVYRIPHQAKANAVVSRPPTPSAKGVSI